MLIFLELFTSLNLQWIRFVFFILLVWYIMWFYLSSIDHCTVNVIRIYFTLDNIQDRERKMEMDNHKKISDCDNTKQWYIYRYLLLLLLHHHHHHHYHYHFDMFILNTLLQYIYMYIYIYCKHWTCKILINMLMWC